MTRSVIPVPTASLTVAVNEESVVVVASTKVSIVSNNIPSFGKIL